MTNLAKGVFTCDLNDERGETSLLGEKGIVRVKDRYADSMRVPLGRATVDTISSANKSANLIGPFPKGKLATVTVISCS
ncbi:Hypothetical protein NTJ_02870 [Nesidiocoris tenuis]|uniref:Uncharacterized protein n=1 Tax=Nesidiocoris tenuis TaxID=355587 RepID=A0ABN7AFN6_9HEMI|nr:Hypothetical protein NTJ_02870 [Nesidiocoris tenuis]